MEATVSRYAKVTERWHLSMKSNPEWRKGQALMNAIWEVDKTLSKVLVDEYIHDCYYHDDRIHDTLVYIVKYYGEMEGV
jgi:hypothetical protein